MRKHLRRLAWIVGLAVLTASTVVVAADVPSDQELVPTAPLQLAQANSLQAEADRLFSEGGQQFNSGRVQQALDSWGQALQIYQEIDNFEGQKLVLTNIGLVHQELGQYEQAIAAFQQQLLVIREFGEAQGINEELRAEEGRTLGQLGILYRESGQYEQAIEVLEQRIDIAREIGDRSGEGSGLGNLGLAYDGLGQYEQAIEFYEQRLVIARELNERDKESLTLGNLAETYASLGEIERAIELLQVSLDIAREVGDRDLEARALGRLEELSIGLDNTGITPIEVQGVLGEGSEEILLGFDENPPDTKRFANTHQIEGLAGQTIKVHVQSDGFIPYLLLVDPEANTLIAQSFSEHTSESDVWLVATLPSDGTYSVQVTTHEDGGSGSYQLKVAGATTPDLLLSDATNLYHQASEQYEAGNFQEALQLNEQALVFSQSEAVRTAFPELSRRQEAFLLGNIGNVYDALGDYDRAIEFQEQAIALKRELGDRPGEAFSLTNLGNTYFRLRDYEKSVESYEQALAIWEELGVMEEQESVLDKLGNTYLEWQKYELSIEFYKQSLELKQSEGNLSESVTVLRNIGIASYHLGDYEDAISFHEQALAIAIELGDKVEEASALGNLANIYGREGNRQRALELTKQSLEITREIDNTKLQVTALDSLASIYFDLGEYQQAITLYQEAIELARDFNELNGEGRVLNNLGFLYSIIGKSEEAIELYERSLELARETNDRGGEALTLSNIAGIHPNPVRAQEFFDQSIDIANNLNNRHVLARAWSDLGQWYLRNPARDIRDGVIHLDYRYQESLDAFQQALSLYQELEMRREEGSILGQIGTLYERTSDYLEAIEYFRESLEIAREASHLRGELRALLNLSRAYWKIIMVAEAETDLEESERTEIESLKIAAEDILLEALTILDSLREGSLSDADKIALFETQKSAYERLQEILLYQGRYEESLVASERARARVLVATLSSQQNLLQDQQDFPTLETIRRTAQQQDATLVFYSEAEDLRTESLVAEGFRYMKLNIWVVSPAGNITWRTVDVAPELPRYAIVLDDRNSQLWNALEEPTTSRESSTTEPRLEDLIFDVRGSIGVRGDSRTGAPPQYNPEYLAQLQAETDQKLTQLHDLLIEPIADLLPSDPNQPVVFIPQGELFLVPFPALKNANGEYLIENHTILTAPSIQVLQLTRDLVETRPVASQQGNDAVIVGNPTMPTVTFLSDDGDFQDVRLNPLFGAQQEAEAISDFLQTPALIGEEATEAAVKQQLASANLIHLATHGLLEYGDPRETGTRDTPGAIALAPGNGEDGLLTSSEILQMDLQADLVVLSACDTGRGRITGDGVIGLSRSFVAAGVPSVIVSLWAVPDAPTAALMTEFYRQLDQGQTKAQALRQAMLTMMQTHPDPKDWAAFTLIGESE